MKFVSAILILLIAGVAATAAPGPGALALISAEQTGASFAQTQLAATGQFTSVDTFDAYSSTPALSAISGYGYVLVWTNAPPNDPVALGNLLANYYDLGGKRLVISTYSFGAQWAITGRVMTGNYVGLTTATNGTVSGSLVAVVPGDPIFNGINLSNVVYFWNGNFAHPGLAPGATLLATDGSGIDMIARSANGVMNVNLYPNLSPDNTQFFALMASILKNGGTAVSSVPAIGPVAGLVLIAGLGLLALFSLRRQTA